MIEDLHGADNNMENVLSTGFYDRFLRPESEVEPSEGCCQTVWRVASNYPGVASAYNLSFFISIYWFVSFGGIPTSFLYTKTHGESKVVEVQNFGGGFAYYTLLFWHLPSRRACEPVTFPLYQ